MKKIMTLIGLTLAFSSVSFAAGTCFYKNSASSFEIPAKDTLNVRAGARTYQLALQFCPNLSWAHSIGFKTFSSWVCQGDEVVIMEFGGSQFPERCYIKSIKEI